MEDSTQTRPTAPQPQRRTFWGRSSRLGGGTGRLIAVGLALGLAVTGALAAGATVLGRAASPDLPENWNWLFPLIFVVIAAPVLSVGAWGLLVDRATVRGAAERPQDSIENRWYDRAAQTTFHVMLPVVGVGAGLASITRWQADTGLVLTVIAVLMLLVFVGSYAWAKRADS